MINRRLTRAYGRLYEQTRNRPEELRKFWKDVDADFRKNNVTGRDLSIQSLWESFVVDGSGKPCGRELMESWGGGGGHSVARLEEAAGAVNTAAFSNITGQIVYNEVMSAWNQPGFIGDQLVTEVPTAFMDGEKIPGISSVGDSAEAIGEGMAYPLTGITEAYIETPRPVKRGHIIPLTKEVIMTDRTGVLLDRAQTITTSMRINKEKRILDTVIGATTSWKRNGSAATATYATSTTVPHNFTNLITDALSDYTDIEAALLVFNRMTDPETGEPIVVSNRQLLVQDTKLFTARRIVNSTQIETRTATSTIITYSPNPLNSPDMGGVMASAPLTILSSPYVRARAANAHATAYVDYDWWLGDFKKAFRYMTFWPLATVPMPSNSDWEFRNDIVRAWKVSEFGVPAVVEPRYVLRSNATS